MPEVTELARSGPTTVAERQPIPTIVRDVLEARRNLQAQDDQLLIDAFRGGYLERVKDSVRICPTGRTDGDDHAPVFASVGLTENPDQVLAPMTNNAFVVQHRAVRVGGENDGTLALPGAKVPALPASPQSGSSTEEEHQ